MNIALDYDNTLTLDVRTWENVVALLSRAGHSVYLVTARLDSSMGPLEWLREHPNIKGVFNTNLQAKRPYMEDRGIEIDVWIDDMPRSVNEDIPDINKGP